MTNLNSATDFENEIAGMYNSFFINFIIFLAITREIKTTGMVTAELKNRITNLQSSFRGKASFLSGFQLRQLQAVKNGKYG